MRITAIDGHPSWIDPVVARFFADARASLGCSRVELANALATTPHVIADLECGRLRALPVRHERERIVLGYGRLLETDVSGILARIQRLSVGADPKSRLRSGRKQALREPPKARSRLGVAATVAAVATALLVMPATFLADEVSAGAVDIISALMRRLEPDQASSATPATVECAAPAAGLDRTETGIELPSSPR